MKLDAWIKQDRPLEERLRVIERLCQAVNEIHDRGNVVGAMEPGRIVLGPEGQCDLSAARKGTPRAPYAAPEGNQSTLAVADIYAAGAVCWEILAGQPAGSAPAHLAKVRPDLPNELADAVMACLERSPDWRPSDLTYLAQMAAARQRAASGAPPAVAARAPLPPRTATKPRRGPSRRTWPLLVALVVVLGLAALAARQYYPRVAGLLPGAAPATSGERATPTEPVAPTTAPPAVRPPAAAADVSRDRPVVPTTAPAGSAPEPDVAPGTAAGNRSGAPDPASPARAGEVSEPAGAPPETATPDADATRDPVPRAAVPPPPGAAAAAPAPRRATAIEPPPPAIPLPPAILSAIAPPTVKRPGKVLVDLRGTGLHPRHRARILPVKKVPWGIKVLRQKHVNDTLITVLLELEETAEPGEYAIAVEDGQGTRSEALTFEVTK